MQHTPEYASEHAGESTGKANPADDSIVMRAEETDEVEVSAPAGAGAQEFEAHQSQQTGAGEAPSLASDDLIKCSETCEAVVESKESKEVAKSKRAPSVERLGKLAQPKVVPDAPEPESHMPEIKPEKKKRDMRPSLLLRVKPINLEEAMEEFFASGCMVAPRFAYTHPEEYVQKHFEANSHIDFELLPEAKRILQKVQDEYGGVTGFNRCLYGDEKVSPEELKETVEQYLRDLGLQDKAEVRVSDKMLSAANVVQNEDRYVVNITAQPVSKNMVQGICDHEVGTHLLRMANDEHQVWHGCRDRYKLSNPWTTEEGFATLNTYLSMTCKLMYPQAMRYWAVCRGAQLGFVELFHELESQVQDSVKRFRMCCRIKRGMIDTSLPGAFYIDQTYFKGAVELLRHLDEIDFGRLYSGQVALQDLDKIHFLLRKDIIRFPKFLNSYETLKAYKAHCRMLIKQNEITTAVDRVCKQMFIRTAKEFFKKPKQQLKLGSGSTCCFSGASISPTVEAPGKTVDLSRLLEMAKPRDSPAKLLEDVRDQQGEERTEFDRSRMLKLAQPKQQEDWATVPVLTAAQSFLRGKKHGSKLRGTSEPASGCRGEVSEAEDDSINRLINMDRLSELSKPRPVVPIADADPLETTGASMPKVSRVVDVARLLKLALPRKKSSKESVPEVPKPKKSKKKKRRSKCRLLAMVQEQLELQNPQNNAATIEDPNPQEVSQSESEDSDEEPQLDEPVKQSSIDFEKQQQHASVNQGSNGIAALVDSSSVHNQYMMTSTEEADASIELAIQIHDSVGTKFPKERAHASPSERGSHAAEGDISPSSIVFGRQNRLNAANLCVQHTCTLTPELSGSSSSGPSGGKGRGHSCGPISKQETSEESRFYQGTRHSDGMALKLGSSAGAVAGAGAKAAVRLHRAVSVGASRRVSHGDVAFAEDSSYPALGHRRCLPAMRGGESEWRPVPIKTLQLGI